MNERETTTFKAGKHEIVAYTYVTGRDLRKIEQVMLDRMQIKANAGGADVSGGLTGAAFAERADLQITSVIISVDGITDKIVDQVLDLPADEYDVVMTYVRSLTEKKSAADTGMNSPATSKDN